MLKDYLRELPHPLISKPLYESVLDSMAKRPLQMESGVCENDPVDSDHAVGSLEILPEVEKVPERSGRKPSAVVFLVSLTGVCLCSGDPAEASGSPEARGVPSRGQ